MKTFLFTLAFAFVAVSCSNKEGNPEWSENRQQMEADAQVYLAKGRKALQQNRFGDVRDIIDKMRHECNLALSARDEAILLLDSVEMQQAFAEMLHADSLMQAHPDKADSLRPTLDEADRKIRFYQRKLKHDKQKK